MSWTPVRATVGGLVALTMAACSSDADGADSRAAGRMPLPPPVIAPRSQPYEAAPLGPDAAVVSGRVGIDGVVPTDTTVRPTQNADVCGASFVDTTVRQRNDGLADVVVWLVGVERGRPIPIRKRYELQAQRCRFEPRVQAMLATGTVNIKSADRLLHETRLLDTRSDETLALVQHNDFGQLVPVQAPFAEARLIVARSDRYPWMRSFIAVFDHPYFDVTDPEGSFILPDVPPGRYELRAWHERFGLLVDSVDVTAGTPVDVRLRMGSAGSGTDAGTGSAEGAPES